MTDVFLVITSHGDVRSAHATMALAEQSAETTFQDFYLKRNNLFPNPGDLDWRSEGDGYFSLLYRAPEQAYLSETGYMVQRVLVEGGSEDG